MSSSFAYEDPLLRQNLSTQQKAREIFKEMGRGMYRSGKGFGKVGALFAGLFGMNVRPPVFLLISY